MKLARYFKSVIFFTLLAVPLVVFAADVNLSHIGALATEGKMYTEWWYTGTNPMLKGVAPANSDVEIMVGDTKSTVKADANGSWSYQLTATGDTVVTLTSSGKTYKFTLHLGQQMPASGTTGTTTQTTGSVPSTGSNQVLGVVFGSSLALLGFYYYLQGRKNHKKAYEKEILDSIK